MFLVAIVSVGLEFAWQEFRRNIARHGVWATFRKSARGRHAARGRVRRSEQVLNKLVKAPMRRASWAAQHSRSAASTYAMDVVRDLAASRRIALDRIATELASPKLRNARLAAVAAR